MAHNDNDQYAEFFDAGHSGKEHTVHQRMRANSTIMELKKILGAFRAPRSCVGAPLSILFANMGCCSRQPWRDSYKDFPNSPRALATDRSCLQL